MCQTKMLVGLVSLLLMVACQQKNPSAPPKETIHPQVDIPWPSLANSPWPMFHHDPQSTGRSQYVGPRKGKIKWTFNPDGAIHSAITIGSDSTIYFGGCYEGPEQSSSLYAVRPDGTLKWKLKLPIGPESQPLIVADGTIFIAGEKLYAVTPEGILKQSYSLGNAMSPFLNIGIDGVLYFVADRQLCAIDQLGNVLWKTHADEKFSAYYSAISPDGEIIYLFNYLNEQYHLALGAVKTDNGEIIWKYSIGELETYDSPLVDSYGNIYFGTFGLSDRTGFYSLSASGTLNWSYRGWIHEAPTIGCEGRLYFQLGSSAFLLVSADSRGAIYWQKNIELNLTTFICDRDGVVYFCSPQNVFAFNNHGSQLWQVLLEGNSSRISAPAIGQDGSLYLGTYAGSASKLYCIN